MVVGERRGNEEERKYEKNQNEEMRGMTERKEKQTEEIGGIKERK